MIDKLPSLRAAKRGRKGTGWHALHKKAYDKIVVPWSEDVAGRGVAFLANPFWVAKCEREKDILVYYAVKSALNEAGKEETVDTCLD